MLRLAAAAFLPLFAAAAAAEAQTPASGAANPRAIELFQSHWVIMDWGLRFHDRDRNAELSEQEAAAGAAAFKRIADADRDGRVTTYEYERAREFLMARY